MIGGEILNKEEKLRIEQKKLNKLVFDYYIKMKNKDNNASYETVYKQSLKVDELINELAKGD